MLEILRSVVFGLEISASNYGLGRVTSAYHFLRIAHTHYYGRAIKSVEAENDDNSRLSVSPAESISNLSDTSDTTVSANESGGRCTAYRILNMFAVTRDDSVHTKQLLLFSLCGNIHFNHLNVS
jgi:hypothetical protein